jgi:hypothetical protein
MDMTTVDLGALTAEHPLACRCFLPVGSWRLNVNATHREYAETLGSLLRQRVGARPPEDAVDVELSMLASPAGGEHFPEAGESPDTVARWADIGERRRMLYTGWFRVVVDSGSTPNRIAIFVREPQYSARAFRDHLFEVLSKVLFSYDRFYVHAAAIDFLDRVSLFVAPGSHGKSTISLALARAGATILSEDHVVLRRDAAARFWASGAQETVRVTAKTETMLSVPLDMEAVPAPGGPKKEFRAGDFFRAAPYVDYPFHRVFFNHVGARFEARPIARRDAVLRFIYMTRSFFRHDDESDLERYLAFFGDLVEGRECFDLELSPDLAALDQLVELLRKEPGR